jgi:hypothetical protein
MLLFIYTMFIICTVFLLVYCNNGGPGSSVGTATAYGLEGRGSNPGRARFSARPDRPWGPPSLLYSGYRFFPGGRCGRGVLLTTLLVPWSWRSTAIPLPTLWATTGPVTGSLYLCIVIMECDMLNKYAFTVLNFELKSRLGMLRNTSRMS